MRAAGLVLRLMTHVYKHANLSAIRYRCSPKHIIFRLPAGLQSVVEEQIYPNVTTGFTDSNAYLRELTLKSMLTLAPKLSQRTLSNSLLKFLAKLQVGLPWSSM